LNPKTTSIFFIILFLSMSTLTFAAESSVPVGAVVAWAGDVYVYHKDETGGVGINAIEGVFPDDVIVTTAEARAKILLNDDSILSIGENSRLKIKDFLLLEEEGKRVALFMLFTGKLRALVARRFGGEGSRFQIETSTAIAEVDGADFIITITEKGSEIVAVSGVVRVRSVSPSISGEVTLEAGLGTTVRQAWALAEPVQVTEERFKSVVEETSMPVTALIQLKESGCVGCHLETFLVMNKQKFVHPGAKRDCKKCHLKQVKTATRKDIPILTYTTEKLIFLDVKYKTPYSVRVKVKDREGREAVSSEVRFTPSTVTTNITNDGIPPLISNLRVEELREGVFYSAVLAWETDEFSTSAVEYGLPGAAVNLFSMGAAAVNLFSMGAQYTKEHRITVGGLFPGKDYIFRVISKDPFGNTARSEDLRLSAENPFSDKEEEELGVWPSVKGFGVVNVGEMTALRWKTNKETAAFVDLAGPIIPALPTLNTGGLTHV
jgi:hypothetical protein